MSNTKICSIIITRKWDRLIGNTPTKKIPLLLRPKNASKEATLYFLLYSQPNQICENYGTKPNYRFLFYYGFLIESNRKNVVYIRLYFNKSDPLEKMKSNMLGCTTGTYIKTFKYFEDFKDNLHKNSKLLGYLRFLQYDSDLTYIAQNYLIPQIKNMSAYSPVRRKLRLPAISISNERQMLMKFKEIAVNCLKKYPQTYEEDLKLLENKTLTYNERNCIVYRAGEKKIYKQMVEMAELASKLLGMSYEEAVKYYKSLDKELIYGMYIEKVVLPLLNIELSK
eukprot:TRINITY_DN135108_c1_g1_i1.p2 TRINITY_DN135108_c1_g1~~TRINITY_DN135108_c1_g1_i1.p2  ORF type:complete len:281 (-),score=29.12 TRINITY_DN135108_c1_g1_i1:805-1647(-)